jgi:hypothetical protein
MTVIEIFQMSLLSKNRKISIKNPLLFCRNSIIRIKSNRHRASLWEGVPLALGGSSTPDRRFSDSYLSGIQLPPEYKIKSVMRLSKKYHPNLSFPSDSIGNPAFSLICGSYLYLTFIFFRHTLLFGQPHPFSLYLGSDRISLSQNKSFHSGLCFAIISSFQCRFHFFIAFSRCIAA